MQARRRIALWQLAHRFSGTNATSHAPALKIVASPRRAAQQAEDHAFCSKWRLFVGPQETSLGGSAVSLAAVDGWFSRAPVAQRRLPCPPSHAAKTQAGTGRGLGAALNEQLMRHALPQLDTIAWYLSGVAIGLE